MLICNRLYYIRGNPNTPCVGVGDVVVYGVPLILPSEKPLLCVVCVMYLYRSMKIYILYIITV